MKKFEMITMIGGLETIVVQKLQTDINKVLTFPSRAMDFYTDNEVKELISNRKEAGWEIIIS